MSEFNVPLSIQSGCLVMSWVAILRRGRLIFCVVFGLWSGGLLAGTIQGINHTHWAINHFSVDGASAIDTVGPFQGGGGGCCYIAPAQWQQGMVVSVEWETGVAYAYDNPGYVDWQKYLEWVRRIKSQSRQHSKYVVIPDFTGEKTCGITVHFLPCDELQVTTSCYTYGHPKYPIKTPLQFPEPQSCPQ